MYLCVCVCVRFCGSRWSKFEINIDRTFTHATIINKLKNPQQKKIYEMEPLFWRSVPKINQKIQFIQFDLKCTWILCRTPFLHNEFGFAVVFANAEKTQNCDVLNNPEFEIISDIYDSFWLDVLYTFCCSFSSTIESIHFH